MTEAKREESLPTRAKFQVGGVALLVLAIAIACVLGRAASARFVGWDDDYHVSQNPDLNPPTLTSLGKYWREPISGLYIPVVYSTWSGLALLARTPKADPEGITLDPSVFHIANLIGHLLASFLVWQIIRRLIRAAPLRDWAAAAGALLFALHPLQVESVAWITGLKDVLCGALTLAALLAFIVARQMTEAGQRRTPRLLLAAATILYAMALLSKPSAVCAPLMAIVIDRLIFFRPWKAMLPLMSLWLAMTAVPVLVTRWAQVSEMPFRASLDLRIFVALDAIGFYVEKLFFPFSLGIDQGHAPMQMVLNGTLHWSWFPGLLCSLVIWFGRRRFNDIVVPALLSLAALAPVLGFSPFEFQYVSTVADRYVYLAMLGPALLLARLVVAIPRPVTLIASSAVIALCAIISFVQTGYWQNDETLMTHCLQVNPESEVALVGLAGERHKQGRLAEAEGLLHQSLRIQPEDDYARFDYGNVLFAEHHVAESIPQYQTALRGHPTDLRLLLNLGAALAVTGRWDQSEKIFRTALNIFPQSAEAHSGLGRVLEQRGDYGGALEQYGIGLQLRPGLPQAQNGENRILRMTQQ